MKVKLKHFPGLCRADMVQIDLKVLLCVSMLVVYLLSSSDGVTELSLLLVVEEHV